MKLDFYKLKTNKEIDDVPYHLIQLQAVLIITYYSV
jgi:hypothetical protein